MAAYDSAAFATSVRQRARAPTATAPGYLDVDLFRAGTEELLTVIVPKLIRAEEEYFDADADTAFTSGLASYSLPSRAVLRKVRDILRIASNGDVSNLVKLEREQFPGRNMDTAGTPTHFYFAGNKTLKVWPVPDAVSGTLRQTYWRRPNRLVATTTGSSGSIGVVSSKTATTITLTAAPPSAWAAGTALDLIQATEPFESLSDDLAISSIAGSVLTFSAVPSTVAAGDYVCLAGEAPVFQIPVEFFAIIAQRVANGLLRGGTDAQALKDGERELERLEAEVYGAVEERNAGEPDYLDNEVWP